MNHREAAVAVSSLPHAVVPPRVQSISHLSPAMEQVLAVPAPPSAEAALVHAELLAHLFRCLPVSAEHLCRELGYRFGASYRNLVVTLSADL